MAFHGKGVQQKGFQKSKDMDVVISAVIFMHCLYKIQSIQTETWRLHCYSYLKQLLWLIDFVYALFLLCARRT